MTDETHYMSHEQCHNCKLDHCCWSLGSFLDGDNKPNNCKEFISMEEEE